MAPIATAYFALIPPLILALLSALLWGSWRLQRRSTHLLWMAGCCALSSIPYAWHVLLPHPLMAEWSPVLGLFYYFSTLCWVMAVTSRLGVALSKAWAFILFVALMSLIVVFARFADHLTLRATALAILLGALVMQSVPSLLRIRHRDHLDRAIVGVHIGFGLLLWLRPLVFVWGEPVLAAEHSLSDTLFWWITVTGALVCCLVLTVLLLASGVQDTIRLLNTERNQDPLTRLLNRRGFDEALDQALRRNQSNRLHTLVVADLDHFKHVNDQHGHAQGDLVLQAFAGQLRTGTRDSDVIARFGGEEFVVLMLDVSPHQARPLVERMRTLLHATGFESSQGRFHISASFGMVQLAPSEPIEQVMKKADVLLYRAKQLGRNRICAEHDAPDPPSDFGTLTPQP